MDTYYTQYYLNQKGGGLADIGTLYRSPLFHQRGRGGIGNFFSGIFRHLRPFVSSGISALKDEAIKSGAAVLTDLGNNKPIDEILKTQGKRAAKSLAYRGINKLQKMQKGGARKKYIKRKKRGTATHSTFKRKQVGGKRRKTKKVKRPRKSTKKKERFVDIFNN